MKTHIFLRLLLAFLCVFTVGEAITLSAQASFKGEILAPSFAVRVKPRPATTRVPARSPAPTTGARTYGAGQYQELFEDALAEGNNALAGKDFAAALLEFDRARAITVDDPRPAIGAAAALAGKGEFAEALTRLEKARGLVESPDNPLPPGAERTGDTDQFYSLLGFAHLKLGNTGEALSALTTVSNLTGTAGAVVLNNLGVVSASLADYPAAERSFEQAQALDQKNQTVRMNRGLLYVILRNREKALAVQREFAASDPYRAGLLQREIENMRPAPEP
jgi:Flp pilus assembly protein TadD